MRQIRIMSKEETYNVQITPSLLVRQEELNPQDLRLLTYSRPKDACEGLPVGRLGNMAGGFRFELLGVIWYGTEHLYLCGEWSLGDEKSLEVQNYIRKMPSGDYAKRCSKAKYKTLIRPDFLTFRHQWMLWCVWQKCQRNSDFAELLKSMPADRVIVEVEKNDPIWAVRQEEDGVFRGANGMGKILTLCRRALVEGGTPEIDTRLLNDAGIYILGERVKFDI